MTPERKADLRKRYLRYPDVMEIMDALDAKQSKAAKVPSDADSLFCVWKIIEGALSGDQTKVTAYAKYLADHLAKRGDDAAAKRMQQILNGDYTGKVALARLLGTCR